MLAANARSAKERTLFIVAAIFSGMVWFAAVITLVGLLYAPFVAIVVVIAHAFLLARITGNAVRLGSRQLPDLYKRVETAAAKLGLERVPEVYVVHGGGILNAFATTLLSRNFVILYSEIVDECERLDEGKLPGEPRAIDFIIGHELGHLALGHLWRNWFLLPARAMPLLGPAYSRACEYSCDACGLATVDNVETAGKALAVLAAGGRQARQVNLDALVEQRHDAGSFVMGLVELNSSHPYLSKRVAAVQRVRDGGVAPEVGRNPFSYVVAPFFSGVAAYVALYAVVIGAVVATSFAQRKDALGALLSSEPPSYAPADDQRSPSYDEALAPTTNPFAAPNADALPAPAPAKSLDELLKELQAVQGAQGGVQAMEGIGGLGLKGTGVPQPAVAAPAPAHDDEEARAWLKAQAKAKNKEAVAQLPTYKAMALVDKLYKAGAVNVTATHIAEDDQGMYAAELQVQLPVRPAARKKLVDLCTAEFKKQGYQDPCEDPAPGNALYFSWQ